VIDKIQAADWEAITEQMQLESYRSPLGFVSIQMAT